MLNGNDRYVVGLIGADIGSSLSPMLHEREADRLGLRYLYQLIDITALDVAVAEVGELVTQARRLGFRGLNITHPCKQEVIKHLDELSPEAAELGAVNTVTFAEGRSVGHNTDRYGFAESFRRGLPGAAIDRVVLLGAGGAGTAVAHAMGRLGAGYLVVVDVDPERSERLVRALDRRWGLRAVASSPEAVPDHLCGADGLINATPVGMEGHPGSPLPVDLVRSDSWIADIIYRPLETGLLRQAAARGCRTLNGGGMVVHQAAEALRIFTGLTPDAGRMLADFRSFTTGSDSA